MPGKKPPKPDPFQFMIENRKVIIDAIEKESSLPNAWALLSERLQQIEQVTKFNTFKGYARILQVVDHELEKSEKKLGKVREERDKVQQQLDRVKEQLPNLLPNLKDKSNDHDVPKRIDGWGVQLKGNYYRLFKKIDGKVKWIHIGRKWDFDFAQEKIKRFMG